MIKKISNIQRFLTLLFTDKDVVLTTPDLDEQSKPEENQQKQENKVRITPEDI